MNLFERIVKYIAIAFAIMLSFGIITGILTGVLAAAGMFSEEQPFIRKEDTEEMDFVKEFSNVKNLKVDISFGRVEIVEGDTFRVTAEKVPDDCVIKMENETLVVERESDNFVNFSFLRKNNYADAKLVIEFPAGFIADTVSLDTGSGVFSVEGLMAEKLQMDTGSGSFVAKGLTAKETGLDTGSGAVTIEDSALGELSMESGSGLVHLTRVTAHDVELESGSGILTVEGSLTGDCSFDTGSGNVDLILYGNRSDYKILSDIGSGGLWVEGNRVKEDSIDISAKHTLDFETGSGRVSLEFKQDENIHHPGTSF